MGLLLGEYYAHEEGCSSIEERERETTGDAIWKVLREVEGSVEIAVMWG